MEPEAKPADYNPSATPAPPPEEKPAPAPGGTARDGAGGQTGCRTRSRSRNRRPSRNRRRRLRLPPNLLRPPNNPNRRFMAADELLDTPVELLVDVAGVGQRLDAFLAERFARHSRVQLRRAISAGGVTVDGKHPKAAYRLRLGERICIVVPEVPRQCAKPEDIPLDVLYEDDWMMAVNKPPGMVVHPARGHWKGTLASALAHHCDQLSTIGGPARPGIVHRLDRDTSGVIVVAKNDRRTWN